MCAGGSVTEERYHFHGEKESRGRAVFRHHDDLRLKRCVPADRDSQGPHWLALAACNGTD